MLLANAMERKSRLATSAVISTGLRRSMAFHLKGLESERFPYPWNELDNSKRYIGEDPL
jgi:hypothetical protein